MADLVVYPSEHSKTVMRGFGCQNITVVPHGVQEVPEGDLRPLPAAFRLGLLGAIGGPDKGLRFVLEAWKRLNYRDGSTLVLAGSHSTTPWVRHLIDRFGGGNIEIKGWVDDLKEFYGNISVLCQPSASEGCGLEIIEAMAHSRAVLASYNSGGPDYLGTWNEYQLVSACNVEELACAIDNLKTYASLADYGANNRELAKAFTWDKIKQRYVSVWRGLLS